MSYRDRLNAAVRAKRTPALVGLDPRFAQLPKEIQARASNRAASSSEAAALAFEEFCCRIIDVVAPLVPAVKPQAAFFEEVGPAGTLALWRVTQYARNAGLIVIMDAKRGDIGSTAEGYARGYLAGADKSAAPWGADALTVSPYLGPDTLDPFVRIADERGAGIYVLVRTSNPGSSGFQARKGDAVPVYRTVAETVQSLTLKHNGAVGAVVGATYPEELAELRQSMPDAPFLVPGYGTQGGTSADAAAAFNADGTGALVNSSRGIIFAYEKNPTPRWEDAVEAATHAMIADLRANTSAGRL
jgi:orotidine-5'-phosphate decarboxylase